MNNEYVQSLQFTLSSLYRSCDTIDAAMFSSDAFHERANRDALRVWMDRWAKELDEYEHDTNRYRRSV